MLSMFSQTAQRDRETLAHIETLLEELWGPMRFLADLNAVWPSLTAEQRKEIEESRTYREQHHRHLAEESVRQLVTLAETLKSYKHRTLRQEVVEFLRSWETEEPDKIKVILGVLRKHH
ncbi:MAG: hypothetical protein COA73_11600 [Candidatus Hydrogenedentota bacterium]|nr:MAG: hypothetical protein COA73_11600 [Candidatus Hydrogenedentota bacterium]